MAVRRSDCSQILARYAAERHGLQLNPVTPFKDYRSQIDEGYDPGMGQAYKANGMVINIAARPDNTFLTDITTPNFSSRPGAKISAQEIFRDRLISFVRSGAIKSLVDFSILSENIEATHRHETTYFGALHNDGHILLSLHNNDENNPGVMFWETTAVRDPLFYRWHAHINDIFIESQSRNDPYDFMDLPDVTAA
jgi:tyrosinase